MNRFFESKPIIYLSKFVDLVLLNVIFLVSCVPVVTAGAAWTAMYYCCVKVIRRDRGKLWAEYLRSFRTNIRPALGAWVFLMAAAAALSAAVYRMLTHGHGGIYAAMIGLGMALLLFTIAIAIYTFPVLSRFTVSASGALKNASVLSVRHGGETVCMVVLTMGMATLFLMGWNFLPLLLLLVPSVYTLLISCMMERILLQYTPEETPSEEEETDSTERIFTETHQEKPWYQEGGDQDE